MTNTEQPSDKPLTTDELYAAWQVDPSPGNMHSVVRSLDPTINYKLASMGVADNPQMKHQARLFTVDAIKKFDPASGTHLRTWAQSQLQSMQRFRRENQGPVKIPDRAAVDGWAIERANRELSDELGREPDVKQLADRSGLSVKRITAVNRITRPVAADAQMYDDGEERPDFLGEALEYVYDESDPIDRKIIEHSTGYGGAVMLQKNEIAAKLGVSPSQITRRSDRIGIRLQEMDHDIEITHA